MTRLALLCLAALPLAGRAQAPAADAAAPATVTTTTTTTVITTTAPTAGTTAALPAGAAAAPLFTLELGGALTLTAASGFGGLDDHHLASYALPPDTARTFGMTIGQSRLHLGLAAPGDGRLSGAALAGRVELDFAGGLAAGDGAQPLVRLRQAWLSARWERLAGLTLLVGQADGLMGGPHRAVSLAHVAIPRFEGAGLLSRRAPQVRLSVAGGGDLALSAGAALLAPLDRATTPVPSAASPTGVGERSGLPDVEGRVALAWRRGGAPLLEVGLSGHAGRETYRMAGGVDASLDAYGAALDLRLDLPWLTLAGAGYAGKNLDVLHTASQGATGSLSGAGGLVAVTGVAVAGGWAQLSLAPLPGLALFVGAGLEAAARADLPFNPPTATVVLESAQVSGGATLELATGWSVGAEYTVYRTVFVGPTDREVLSGQLELATRYAF